ncbi:MAG TPA: ATP-binding protein [Lutibacter sp.]|nr:ATP-binding protein [Lutibacter sp.]
MNYQRSLQTSLSKLLFKGKALIIIGARQVGKTTMLKDFVSKMDNTLWLNADENNVRERLTGASLNTLKNIIGSYKIVVIDEIQRVKNAGLLLKLMVDNFKDTQFIATGSSALEISDTIFEPLTGRQFLFNLHPFSISELYPTQSPFEIEQELQFHLVYGNYPEVCMKREIAKDILKNLAEQYLYKDVLVWKDIRKPEMLDKLLKLLAYQIGSEVSIHELANQLKVKSETVENYIDLLEKSYVIYRLKSYTTNKRKEVSKMSKILFWDNGIRNAIINDYSELSTRNDQDQLFENFIISERIKKNVLSRTSIQSYFWRHYNQSEIDYIEKSNDDLSAFEIKWNAKKKHRITKSFTNLYTNAKTQILTPENFVDFLR